MPLSSNHPAQCIFVVDMGPMASSTNSCSPISLDSQSPVKIVGDYVVYEVLGRGTAPNTLQVKDHGERCVVQRTLKPTRFVQSRYSTVVHWSGKSKMAGRT